MPDPLTSAGISVAGSLIDYGLSQLGPSGLSDRKAAALAYEYQQRLNQNAIQDRVADAKKAGIHPLFALGANVNPGSINVVGGGKSSSAHDWSGLGQDLSRSMAATLSSDEREAAKTATALALEKAGLENDLLRSQIARENSAQVGVGGMNANTFIPGAGNARVQPIPATPVVGDYSSPGKEAGDVADFGYARTANGGLAPVPSKDMADRLDMEAGIFPSVPSIAWMWRNGVTPNFPWNWSKHATQPPLSSLPKGAKGWRWHISSQAWLPAY